MDPIRSLDGRDVRLLPDALHALQRSLSGDIITRASPDYERARAVWNGRIDRHPALIARCADAADVRTIFRFVAEHALLMTVRAGGHDIGGYGTCDGGVVIDLSRMRTVRVDPSTQTASVDPGCTVADMDRATQAFGLATPLGIVSTIGVAGLTLGGGFGWLSRRYGFTADNLISANVVTASGNLVRASETEHDALFWAIRGGGGNVGLVTSFEFALHRLGPHVFTGLIVHPLDSAGALLRYYRDFMARAPDELAVWVLIRRAPPLPFLPPKWQRRDVCILACCYTGSDHAEGARLLAPLRAHGTPVAQHFASTSYTGWQQTFDSLYAPGAQNYWKSHNLTMLSDGLIDRLLEQSRRLPSDESEILIAAVGGGAATVPENRIACGARSTQFVMNAQARWHGRSPAARCIEWARETFVATAPYAAGSVHVNYLSEDESERIPSAYGANWPRLIEVKQQYDPYNLFRVNRNVVEAPVRELVLAPQA